MKRLLLLSLLLSFAFSWPVQRIAPSIGKLRTPSGQCSAFSIHAKKAFWISATHCFVAGFENGIVNDLARVEKIIETAGELTVFQTDTRFERAGQYPALKLGAAPSPGQSVLNPSYGGDAPKLIFFEGLFLFEMDGRSFLTTAIMPGMSGSPILNRNLRVVGVVVGALQPTASPLFVSVSVPYADLAKLIKKHGG